MIINYSLKKKLFFPAFNPAIAYRPATGYRNNTTGGLDLVGTRGYAWSSSSYASGNPNAARLRFAADLADPLISDNRAAGFPVRCVQHLRLFFMKNHSTTL